jgi:4-deoxy-L-threo-5-hexosulose-uronate ketol-isomerase
MILYTPDPVRFSRMTTEETRQSFLLQGLFNPGQVTLTYVDVDRVIVGSIVPLDTPLTLPTFKELAASFFAERREVGILNIGAKGRITVDDQTYSLQNKSVLYIGKGSKKVIFESENPAAPAQYYMLSYPAHKEFPTSLADISQAAPVHLGSMESANKRTIYKMIHAGGIKSCQLVMGFTELDSGCVWNTMPPHTHPRRMEVYLYFDMNADVRVFHLMGPPQETRHIVMNNKQAIVSPSWSIHSGVGTGRYTFCWGMGGENQDFDDMDAVDMGELR